MWAVNAAGPRTICTYMRHFDDSALSELMAGELDEREIRQLGSHIRECTRCARRFEGWRPLFPQVERLLDDAPAAPVVMLPGGPTLILPDRESGQRLLVQLRRVKVLALLLVLVIAGILAVDHRDALLGWIPGWQPVNEGLDPPVIAGRASVPAYLDAQKAVPQASAGDSQPADTVFSTVMSGAGSASPIPTQGPPAQTTQPPGPTPATHAPAAPTPAAKPASKPSVLASVDPARGAAQARPVVTPAEAEPPAPERTVVAPATPGAAGRAPVSVVSAAVFQPVSMELAIVALGGTIRELKGLERLSLEAGPGAIVDGASPDADVVRMRYRSDSGIVTLVEQRRSPGQAAAEARVAVFQEGDGPTTARWVDASGIWLMLQARGSRGWLLSLANAVH